MTPVLTDRIGSVRSTGNGQRRGVRTMPDCSYFFSRTSLSCDRITCVARSQLDELSGSNSKKKRHLIGVGGEAEQAYLAHVLNHHVARDDGLLGKEAPLVNQRPFKSQPLLPDLQLIQTRQCAVSFGLRPCVPRS